MQVTETLTEGLKREFTVVVPQSEISERREKRLAELSRSVNLPGFRPGKVPLSMVRKRYGDAVSAEVIEGAVNDASDRLLSERNLRPAVQPELEVTKPGQDSDLEFSMKMEILPEIGVPGFGDIRVRRPVAEVSEDKIMAALDRLVQQARSFEAIEPSRPAQQGDQLTINFVGRIGGEAFQGGSGEGMRVVVAGPGFIPGFSEQLEGLSPGETRTITVAFPAEYGQRDLAGKEATFEITATSLEVPKTPALDDEFAKTMGVESLAELRKVISDRLSRDYAEMSRLKQKRELLDALAERAQFAVPDALVEAEFAEIWRQVEQEKAAGRGDPEDAAKDEATLKADYRAIAERRVRLGLLIAEIGRLNGVSVTPGDLQEAMFAEATKYGAQAGQVLEFFRKNPQAQERFRGPIFEDKVVDYLLGQVQLEDVTITEEALAADPALNGVAGE